MRELFTKKLWETLHLKFVDAVKIEPIAATRNHKGVVGVFVDFILNLLAFDFLILFTLRHSFILAEVNCGVIVKRVATRLKLLALIIFRVLTDDFFVDCLSSSNRLICDRC